jgi:hypothetical protein
VGCNNPARNRSRARRKSKMYLYAYIVYSIEPTCVFRLIPVGQQSDLNEVGEIDSNGQ